jgi:hypothetical protein
MEAGHRGILMEYAHKPVEEEQCHVTAIVNHPFHLIQVFWYWLELRYFKNNFSGRYSAKLFATRNCVVTYSWARKMILGSKLKNISNSTKILDFYIEYKEMYGLK